MGYTLVELDPGVPLKCNFTTRALLAVGPKLCDVHAENFGLVASLLLQSSLCP